MGEGGPSGKNTRVPVVLVGNKNDLHLERVVSTDQGRRLADNWKAAFLETSAKEHEAVNDIFTRAILEIERADGNLPPGNGCHIS
ncbi:GTP-binding protein Rheb [Portunus trituberculatus]|uniref:GTP-binding protein Rheb n=1 Tax=Portunus trituberculatus TaxID=210409 RepID=A0A5B7D599_PORTR|nr:GTP-binding protein Rheb [Portunus trituberculatus]